MTYQVFIHIDMVCIFFPGKCWTSCDNLIVYNYCASYKIVSKAVTRKLSIYVEEVIYHTTPSSGGNSIYPFDLACGSNIKQHYCGCSSTKLHSINVEYFNDQCTSLLLIFMLYLTRVNENSCKFSIFSSPVSENKTDFCITDGGLFILN